MATETKPSPFDFGRVNIHTAKDHNLRLTDSPKSKEVSNTQRGQGKETTEWKQQK